MPGSKEGILQYNPTSNQIELIRAVRVPDIHDLHYQIEEFMTGKSLALVGEKSLTDIRRNDNLHNWNRELFGLKAYVKMVREIHRLVEHHGCNEEVFGPRKEQQFILASQQSEMCVAMQVTCDSMLMALNTSTVGICMDGSLLRHGTVTTFRTFVAAMHSRKDHYINSVPMAYRDSLYRQFNEAVAVELDEVGQFYTRTFEEPWSNYLGHVQVQEMLAVSHTTLNRYRSGQVPGDANPFPNPDRFRGRSPYWHKTSIARWMDSRRF